MSEVRFDPETGILHGTKMPSVADLVAGARANGLRFIRGMFGSKEAGCGCALGVAIMITPGAIDDDGGLCISVGGKALELDMRTWLGVLRGFDGLEDRAEGPNHSAGHAYGSAAHSAAIEAELMLEWAE